MPSPLELNPQNQVELFMPQSGQALDNTPSALDPDEQADGQCSARLESHF